MEIFHRASALLPAERDSPCTVWRPSLENGERRGCSSKRSNAWIRASSALDGRASWRGSRAAAPAAHRHGRRSGSARYRVPPGSWRHAVVRSYSAGMRRVERQEDRVRAQPQAAPHRTQRKLRHAFLAGAEERSRRHLDRGLTKDGLEPVLRRYPGDLPER